MGEAQQPARHGSTAGDLAKGNDQIPLLQVACGGPEAPPNTRQGGAATFRVALNRTKQAHATYAQHEKRVRANRGEKSSEVVEAPGIEPGQAHTDQYELGGIRNNRSSSTPTD